MERHVLRDRHGYDLKTTTIAQVRYPISLLAQALLRRCILCPCALGQELKTLN